MEDVSFVSTIKDWLRHIHLHGGLDKSHCFSKQGEGNVSLEEHCNLSQRHWEGKPEDYLPIHTAISKDK
jgi:hypothetical protein